jgi:hypothetical protein
MTWTTTPYCTRADVKMSLDPNMTTVDDDFLNMLITQAQADIDREVGYMFQQDGTSSSPATRLYDGNGRDILPIDDLIALYQPGTCTPTPCGAVFETYTATQMSGGGIWITSSPITTDITADMLLKPNNANPVYLLQRNSGLLFVKGNQNYKVLGIFGEPILPGQVYPGVPNDIMRATIRLVTHYYKMRDTNYADMTQEQGGVRERYNKMMPPDVVEVIQRYKRRRFLTR